MDVHTPRTYTLVNIAYPKQLKIKHVICSAIRRKSRRHSRMARTLPRSRGKAGLIVRSHSIIADSKHSNELKKNIWESDSGVQ
jgi:hypothetical protein